MCDQLVNAILLRDHAEDVLDAHLLDTGDDVVADGFHDRDK